MKDDENILSKDSEAPNYWQLIMDVLAFQAKLAMDGIRDVILSPISLFAMLYGIATHRENPALYFNNLLKFGRKTDVWINLFGATDHYSNDGHDKTASSGSRSSDAYIKKLEDLLVNEYHKGGLVHELKEGTEGLINRIRKDRDRGGDKSRDKDGAE